MSKRILVVVSEWGFWGEELVGPLEVFEENGYEVDFMTPTGKRPVAIGVSMDPDYVDPPLGRSVTSNAMAEKVKEIDSSPKLDNPLNLSELMPERPYHSEDEFLRKEEAYYRDRDARAKEFVDKYDALLIVGGSGPIVDLVNNQRLHDLILAFYDADKLIGAECYGVTCLAFARNWEERKSIISGKHVTGHCIEYDYKYGTGFMGTNFVMGPPPYATRRLRAARTTATTGTRRR
jgi:putative intracellular protease/amidase